MGELRRKIEWLFANKRNDREALARCYADFAANVGSLGVSFGSPPRDDPNPDGHYNWARSEPRIDLVKSEMLQRLDVLESL